MIDINYRIGKKTGSISRIIEKEAIVILPAQGQVKVLNEVGARIWELVDGHKSTSDLIDIICEEYDISREEVEQDTMDFVQRMLDVQLLEIVA